MATVLLSATIPQLPQWMSRDANCYSCCARPLPQLWLHLTSWSSWRSGCYGRTHTGRGMPLKRWANERSWPITCLTPHDQLQLANSLIAISGNLGMTIVIRHELPNLAWTWLVCINCQKWILPGSLKVANFGSHIIIPVKSSSLCY